MRILQSRCLRTLLFGKELSKRASNCIGLLWSVINYVDAQRNYVCQRATNSFNSGLNLRRACLAC